MTGTTQRLVMEGLQRWRRWSPHCPLWSLLDCSRQWGGWQPLSFWNTLYPALVTTSQMAHLPVCSPRAGSSSGLHFSNLCLVLQRQAPSTGHGQSRGPLTTCWQCPGVDEACGLLLSGAAPFGRVWEEHRMGKARRGLDLEELLGSQVMNTWILSEATNRFCLQTLKNPKISHTNRELHLLLKN